MGELLEAAAYRRLLLRLVALPIFALGILAVTLFFGIREVQRAGRRVDVADQVIAHTNNLIKLIIDGETGFRGYLLTRDPAYLQPYREADRSLASEFSTLYSLSSHHPEQIARLKRVQALTTAWWQESNAAIQTPAAESTPARMQIRKQQMDTLRAAVEDFLAVEQSIHASHAYTALRVDRFSLIGLLVLAGLLALLLAWEIRRLFQKLAAAYNQQIAQVRRWGDECYERQQWLTTTLRSIGDAVIACDVQGRVEFMNRVAERLTGWQEAAAKGRALSEIFTIVNQHSRTVVESPVDKVRRFGTVVGLANHTILISKNQSEFHIDDSAAPILDAHSAMKGVVLVFRDITQRHAAEAALLRAEKLASAGRLAAAIAHEVNNPLEGLVNLIYLARSEQDLEKIRAHLTEADRELQRIAHITRQSLGFYRETSSATLFQPGEVAREVFEFYSPRAASTGVSLHVKIATDQKVYGNPGELRQVLSNLLANSLDACGEGDRICVRVRPLGNPQRQQPAGVRISLADTGSGIHPDHLSRIFEPFFTTKKDTGTGLGLWVSRELIEKHGGTLNVRSRVQGERSGTIFSMVLPAVQANPA